MKAYGDKISAGYLGNKTQKSWCRCCNGNYAKVGRAGNKRNNLRGLKKSARQANRSIAVSELEEYEEMFDPEFISNLKWNLEMKLSNDCYEKEVNSPEYKFAITLKRFGLPFVNPHKCTCPNPDKLSDKEILELSGIL